jgi:hypothetical protein
VEGVSSALLLSKMMRGNMRGKMREDKNAFTVAAAALGPFSSPKLRREREGERRRKRGASSKR